MRSTRRSSAHRESSALLAGRLIVVTGASAGIGEAIARRLAADGARLVLIARRRDRLEELAATIGGGALAIPVDLADPDAAAAACAQVLEQAGVPDAIINNAGAGAFQSLEESTVQDVHDQMDLPYFAAVHTTMGFLRPMLARGSGVIFQINSPVSVVPWPGAVGYAAARFALRGFTEALREDLHGSGLAVGSLTPTRVHSDYFTANPGSVERVPKVEALVGTMRPEEVAEALVRALVERPGKDTHVPWRWGLMQPLARAFPSALTALYRRTGHQRA